MTAENDSTRTVLKVRYNRRLLWWLIAVTLPLNVVNLIWSPIYLTEHFLGFTATVILAGTMGGSIGFLSQKTILVYDIQRRRLLGPHGRMKQHPNTGFVRLEYSVYDARIYEVRLDGKRRKVAGASVLVNRQDWQALVDLLLAQ